MNNHSFNEPAWALLVALVAFALLVAIQPADVYLARTPELIGDTPLLLAKYGDLTVGVMWSDYAGFVLYGRGDGRVQCRLLHAWGGAIVGAEDAIPCLIVWRENGKFRGWIDFRGHPRQFCGAGAEDNLPELCIWKTP